MKAKRTVAGVVACMMLAATAVSVQASAADASVTLSGAKVTAEAGGEFSVDVSLADIPASKINVLDFAVNYDASVLNVTDVTIGAAADTSAVSGDTTGADAPVFSTNIVDGQIVISWTTSMSSDAWIAEDGVIFTINGTVDAAAADGVYPLTFAAADRETYDGSGVANTDMLIGYVYGTDSAEYDIVTDNGSVTVGKAVTTTATSETGGADTTTTTKTSTTATSDTDKPTTDTTGSTAATTAKTTIEMPNENVLYGDVNVDGKIELTDAIALNKYCADVITLNEAAMYNADCTADGLVDTNDAIALLRFLVHSITSLPGE